MMESIASKWKKLKNEMTIEPAIIIATIGTGLSSVVVETMLIERICRITLNNTEVICKNLSSNEKLEKDASAIVATYQMYGNIFSAGFPILFALFLGPWIDRHGTKTPMLLSVMGFGCANLFCALLATKIDWSPVVLLFGAMPSALTGGNTAFLMALLTFISRKTDEANRSFRIGVMEAVWFIGYSSGVQIGARIFDAFGYVPVFLTAASFVGLAFIYLCIYMKEDPISETGVSGEKTISGREKFKDIFQVSSIKETFYTCFKKRESSRRLWVLLLVFMICLRVLAMDGSLSLMYLYTRAKFGWDNAAYSLFLQIKLTMSFVGMLSMIGALNTFKWKDTGLGIFSAFGYVVVYLTYAFAQSGWMMYLGAATATPFVLISIVIRSAISKLVAKDELGRIFSAVQIGEACVPLVSSTIFNPIYSHTVRTVPGTIYIVAAALHGVIGLLFVYLFSTMGKVKATESTDQLDEIA